MGIGLKVATILKVYWYRTKSKWHIGLKINTYWTKNTSKNKHVYWTKNNYWPSPLSSRRYRRYAL